MPDPFWETHLIYRVVAGSRAYGLDTPESDTDTRGVCIPPAEILLGLTPFEQWEDATRDNVVYALVKFVRLALDCNPNIIEALYADPRHILHCDAYGEELRAHRALFLTRQAGQTFSGYAISQLRRLERHHRWLENPPDHQPAQEEYGGRFVGGRYKFPDHDAEKAYRAALKHWNHYAAWRRDRNPARAALEARYGYDTKHAMHLLRLLRMGMEILATGEVHVYRPDREWLLAVRNGLLTYEELLALAAEYEARLSPLATTTHLPEAPDAAQVAALVVELQTRHLQEAHAASTDGPLAGAV
ncbi:MAG TPA: nucleotidyltransferase domain-containing protein [Anaerolineae bacterium]|nr:nucleotidyltransferase domain-containing protein [Anaerolineae bacterium]